MAQLLLENPPDMPFLPFFVHDARSHHVYIDLVGPLSPPLGHRFRRTSVNRFNRWCETIPLPDRHAEIRGSLQSIPFGAPKSLTTDCCPQFELSLVVKL